MTDVWLKYIAIYNPLFITDSLLKKLILFSEPIASMWLDFVILAGMVVVLMLVTIFARKITKRWL